MKKFLYFLIATIVMSNYACKNNEQVVGNGLIQKRKYNTGFHVNSRKSHPNLLKERAISTEETALQTKNSSGEQINNKSTNTAVEHDADTKVNNDNKEDRLSALVNKEASENDSKAGLSDATDSPDKPDLFRFYSLLQKSVFPKSLPPEDDYRGPVNNSTNTFALLAFIFALLSVALIIPYFGFLVILGLMVTAIIFGVKALRQIKTTGEKGKGMAIAAIIISAVMLVIVVLLILLLIFLLLMM